MIQKKSRRPSHVEEFRERGFLVSTDRARLDVDVIYRFLTNCYWARGIPKETVKRSLRNSLCVGAYKAGKQIGFARVVSDFATYAYIGDVFVIDEYRRLGVSKLLMQCIMEHPRLQNLRRWSLVTRDAHGLYAKFGFTPLHSPERHMEIHNRDVYKNSQQQN